jgi:hypothetical protein
MNHRITSIGLALLISLAGSACASTIDLDRQAVEIVATPEARLAAQAVLADPYGEYQYAMSNGRRLSVTTSGQTLIVQLRAPRADPAAARRPGAFCLQRRPLRAALRAGRRRPALRREPEPARGAGLRSLRRAITSDAVAR